MKRNYADKFISVFLIFTLFMAFVAFPALHYKAGTGMSTAYADESTQSQIDQKQDEVDQIKEQREEVQNDLAAVAEEVKELQGKVDDLNNKIAKTTQEIKNTENKIAKKKEDIKKKQEEIQKKKDEIQEREEGLDQRLVVMYKNGSIGFVDVLMGSNSISEFVSNVEMIQKIYENDVEILKILEQEHKKLEEEEKKLEEERKQLIDIQAQLKVQVEELDKQKEELKTEKSKLDKKKKTLEAKDAELKRDADALISQIKALQDANRVYEGGTFTWPVPSSHYISSSFGSRLHPIYRTWRMHTGTDIAASYGSNIVAAASGKVIMSSWYGGYGNCIMIDHGSGMVTLYGHCSSRLVSAGQEVSRGQVIARVGSTGNSTGNHCHFEVRINGQYVNPMGYFS